MQVGSVGSEKLSKGVPFRFVHYLHQVGEGFLSRDPLLDSNPTIGMRYCFKIKTSIRYESKKLLMILDYAIKLILCVILL